MKSPKAVDDHAVRPVQVGDGTPGAPPEVPDALIGVDEEGQILSWSGGAEALYGYPAAEAIGAPYADRVATSEERDAARAAVREAVARGALSCAATRRHRDGQVLHVEVALQRAELAGGARFVAVHERAVAAPPRPQIPDSPFRALIESAPDAMVIVDPSGQIRLVNAQAEALFGYPRAELLGQPVELLMPERYRGAHVRHRAEYGAEPRSRGMGAGLELRGRCRDGREFPIEISLSPLVTDRGMLYSSAIRDISERHHLQEEMREANRHKSEFLANMSHELRTPLNAIVGFSELLYRGEAGALDEMHREFLGDILTSARHLLQLINDILDLSKIEAGHLELVREPIEPAQLAAEVRDVLRGLATAKQLRVEIVADAGLGVVEADPRRFKQVLYNYLSNAIKFTAEGGTVTVRFTREPEALRLDVEDTGIGIAPEDLPQLFSEFRQLDGTARKRYSGTGLGLALTRRVVEAHGGWVEVRSELGRGSTFSAVLPRASRLARLERSDREVSHGG